MINRSSEFYKLITFRFTKIYRYIKIFLLNDITFVSFIDGTAVQGLDTNQLKTKQNGG